MKKAQLLSVLLWVGASCVINTGVAVAAIRPANKPVVDSGHKKNKTVKKTNAVTRSRQMSEKDIAECTQLIDRVAKTDKIIHSEMLNNVANSNKIADHLKKPAEVQLFASDDPVAIAHLTGKSAKLPTPQPSKTLVPIIPASSAKLTPAPIFKPTTATLVATSSSKPKSVVVPPHTTTKPTVSKLPPVALNTKPINNKITTAPLANTTKPVATKPITKPLATKQPTPRPHIELFAPNTPDLNHLEGKSASLTDFQKTAPIDNSATITKKKTKTNKSKKTVSTASTSTKTKKK